ncbi:MAG: hypothetical protein WCH74_03475 [Chloroflexota bacterium]
MPEAAAAAIASKPKRSAASRSVRVLRRGLTWVLIVLVAVGVLGTTVAYWADQTLFNTDRFVATVAPIVTDPAVIESVSTDVSTSIVDQIGLQRVVDSVLPADLQGMGSIVVLGVQTTIQKAIADFMATPQFAAIWEQATRAVHSKVVGILRGDTSIIESTGGVVSVDVFPLVNEGLKAADKALTDATGRDIALPQLTDPTNAAASRAEIEQALGVTLPPDFGQITIADTSALDEAKQVLRVFEASIVVAGIVTLIIAVLAILIAIRRRRAFLQVVLASGIGLALALVVVARINQVVVDAAPAGTAGATARAAIESIVGGFAWYAITLAVALGVVAIALYIAGRPSWIPRWGRSMRTATGIQPSGNRLVRLVAEHIGELRLLGYVIAIVALLLVPLGLGTILGTLGVLIAYQLLLTVIRAFRPADIRAAEGLA